jgi:hypothetical protein
MVWKKMILMRVNQNLLPPKAQILLVAEQLQILHLKQKLKIIAL